MKGSWKLLLLVLLASVGASVGTVSAFLAFASPHRPTEESSPGERLLGLEQFAQSAPSAPGRRVVAALGRIRPRDGLIEVGGKPGDRVERLPVKQGDWVKAGAELAYLDSYDELQAEKASLQAQLAEAQRRLTAETVYAEALIGQARVELEEAERLGPHQVALQTAQVRLARTDLQTAEADLARLRKVHRPGVVSEQQLEHQQALVSQAGAKLQSAQAALAQAEAAFELNRSKARAQLDAARARLEQVRSTVPVDSLDKQIKAVGVRLERAVIRAHAAGRVLSIDTHPGEQTGQQPILTMADTRAMSVLAEVYESDIHCVRVGQRATVTSPALARPLHGVVERVGQVVYQNGLLHVDPAAIQDARVVEAEIRLDDPEAASDLIHLQVDVEIELAGPAVPEP